MLINPKSLLPVLVMTGYYESSNISPQLIPKNENMGIAVAGFFTVLISPFPSRTAG